MAKINIEPQVGLTISASNGINIVLIVTDKYADILHSTHIQIGRKNQHDTFKNLLDNITLLIEEYDIDTIIMEQNKLFIDKIEKYPDPYVLQDILTRYKINTLVHYTFYDKVKYIFELPEQEWRSKILNKLTRYAIDLYKNHIMYKLHSDEQISTYEKFNYYKCACLSESILYDSLMNKKYLTNKEN